MAAMIINIAMAAVAVGMLILVHEFGHFIVAKAIGVRVEIFSIGFGTPLLSFGSGETEYRLSAVPLGGYVKMAGEHPDEGEGKPDEFYSKSPGERALVFVAGVTFNMVLAVFLFIAAFTIGVEFTEASVGQLQRGGSAWKAGLREGDMIEAADGEKIPDYNDLTRYVALSSGETVKLKVKRDGQTRSYTVHPRYNPEMGFDWIGFSPRMTTQVGGLATKIGGSDGRGPAKEAGIKLGDRIRAVNGTPVQTAGEISEILDDQSDNEVRLLVERNGETFETTLRTEPQPQYGIGISYVNTTIEDLQGGGMAAEAGFRAGDTITEVNGESVRSVLKVDRIISDAYGEVEFTVLRNEDETVTLKANIPDRDTLDTFLFSLTCGTADHLTWVGKDTPAWNAGMRPGQTILKIGDKNVKSWEDIRGAIGGAEPSPVQVTWNHDGEQRSATVTPVNQASDSPGKLGIMFTRPHTVVQQYGIGGAITAGLSKTKGTLTNIYLTFRGIARQKVSPKTMGGVMTIAYMAYSAAKEGIGKLLYWVAIISAMLAVINILPIPVLDGGHLLFVAIEKVRGKPVPESVMAVTQYIGLGLLIMLMLYVTKNDIVRLFGL